MIYRVCAFTEQGRALGAMLESRMPEHVFEHRTSEENLKNWTEASFEDGLPLVFIGACGIAVRTIAPFVNSKLTDSPVIVLDEGGKFVIPVLSGHVGQANLIARTIAERMGAEAVITTATDIRDVFSVDTFAVRNGLEIGNKDGIRAVSAKLLKEGVLTVRVSPRIEVEKNAMPECLLLTEEETADLQILMEETPSENALLTLRLKKYVLGIGCKKDTPAQKIKEAVARALEQTGIEEKEIFAAASVDQKAKETGLLRACAARRIPFYTYSAEELRQTEGSFSHSDFVEKTIGVDNVCERAAMRCAGEGAVPVLKKQAMDGVTIAIAERRGRIDSWET